MSSRRVLITGANGLLGANTARALYRAGFDLRLLIRPLAGVNTISDIPCEIYHGDITDPEEVMNAVKDCDYVVHSASLTAQWRVGYQAYKQVNITGTKNIVEACLAHGVKKLIYISTANTIGPGTKERPASELNAFTLFHVNSGYINSKYIAQQYISEQIECRKLPAVIVNPTFMIGPYDSKPSSGQIILHGINKRVIFYPPGGKNFVHVDDVCTGIINALEAGKIGDLYLMAGENLTYKEFFKKLNSVSGQRNVMIRIPPFILKTLGLAGSLLGRLTGVSGKMSTASAYMLCLFNYYSGGKSERELYIKYTPIEQAIKSALLWFRDNKYC